MMRTANSSRTFQSRLCMNPSALSYTRVCSKNKHACLWINSTQKQTRVFVSETNTRVCFETNTHSPHSGITTVPAASTVHVHIHRYRSSLSFIVIVHRYRSSLSFIVIVHRYRSSLSFIARSYCTRRMSTGWHCLSSPLRTQRDNGDDKGAGDSKRQQSIKNDMTMTMMVMFPESEVTRRRW